MVSSFGGWVGGIKIKANSVQLQLELPVRTELGNNDYINMGFLHVLLAILAYFIIHNILKLAEFGKQILSKSFYSVKH